MELPRKVLTEVKVPDAPENVPPVQVPPRLSFFRRMLHKFIPADFHNIFGLTYRLLFKGEGGGRYAMFYAMLGAIFSPLDSLLAVDERKLYASATQPKQPMIFVCGPARSGTTVAAQTLIGCLPVAYFNNLTSVFPRAPITAEKKLARWIKNDNRKVGVRSFYGRTVGWASPNDALYFWDRWMGADRRALPEALSPEKAREMQQFFAAYLDHAGKPILNKNNSLAFYADLVAPVLPTAYFICMDRDPLFLAQSHLQARAFIHGDEHIPYGLGTNEDFGVSPDADPIEQICHQLKFYQEKIDEVARSVGEDRFIRISYDDFCQRPEHWIQLIHQKVWGTSADLATIQSRLPELVSSNKIKMDPDRFVKLKETWERIQASS